MNKANRDSDVWDVVVIAGAGVDTTVYVPELPLPYAETYVVPPVIDRIGNTGSGVVLGCGALGLRVALVDLLGEDPQGDLVRAHLESRGVELVWRAVPEGTRRSVLLVGPDGRRTSLFDPRPAPGRRLPRELYLPLVRTARHVHVSIDDAARDVYADISDIGVPVSTDLHDWDGEEEHHRDFAYNSDLVFLSAAKLPDPESVMRDILARGRASVVVCTAGAEGCHVLVPGWERARRFPAVPLPGPVVDSNGAGDAFVSGFLYGRLSSRPLEECVRLGAIAGAHACTVRGTHESPIDERTLLDR
ncbi:PfkB family carbohydrate kinase [Thermopolyspora sp. NPDC052614]|uniref:carbohydrate kinase family protein n=1 Tax=Thermopolyspora sp. NPDC052614 TaxID=3155682 RepID=UPI003439F78E